MDLAAGKHQIEFRCVGRSEKSTNGFLGLVALVLRSVK